MRHAIRTLFAALALLPLVTASPADAQVSNASAVVEAFHAALLEAMKNSKSLGIKGRYDLLTPAIDKAFNLKLTVRVAAGTYWKRSTDTKRDKLTIAFRHLSISTYASQFKGYSGQSFKTKRERKGPQRTLLVATDIVRPNKKPVGLTYVMKKKKGEWKIVDVLLDNTISQLAVRRSEYRSILKNGGIDHLIVTLEAQADKIMADSS